MYATLILLGLVNWISTLLLVEAELFREVREAIKARRNRSWLWGKGAYLVGCHLCTGTWVAFAMVACLPDERPFGAGLVGFVLTALAIKAIGHFTLEVAALLQRCSPKKETADVDAP